MTLAALQRDFCQWLARDDPAIAVGLGLADARGLSVYQNNFRAQLVNCLAASLPHTLAWLGQDRFLAAAATHVDIVAPGSWTLDDYPEDFPVTLRALFPDDPEVAELALLEWTLGEVFVAADATPLTTADLPRIDWERAELRFVPSVRVLTVMTNAPEIRAALDQDLPPPPAAEQHRAETLLLWRQDFTCCLRPCDETEREFLHQLGRGLKFDHFCRELVERHGHDVGIAQAGQLLARWAGEGLLLEQPACRMACDGSAG